MRDLPTPSADSVPSADDDATTRIVPGDALEGDALARVLQHRPTDHIGARRVLANLESRLLGRPAEPNVASRYVLLGQIGAGGLGVVYAAYDSELDRRVALKFLQRAEPGDRGRERLVREAQAMARLAHPNVVTVYDVGTIDEHVFIAMELVDGVPLSTWWRARKRSWREVRAMMVQAARGLYAAHQAGLVHRDFKPQNVLVGSDGRARVLDFGLARRTSVAEPPSAPSLQPRGAAGLHTPITATGTIMGTPAYMAPEQLGEADVGPVADQFSFCVALYEGLYGVRPFRGEDLLAVQNAIRTGNVSPPPAMGDVPAWLHRAVMRGLSPRPEDRFASMRELVEAITRDHRTRRRYWIAIALLASLLAGAATGALLWLRPQPSAEDLQRIEALAASADDAAQEGIFVYPPVDDPSSPTVYRVVRELEQIEGPAAALARDRAAELRQHYAQLLVDLGDAWWQREGGAPFAADYYAAALVFDETHSRALERASLTRGELADLVARADKGAFSEGELAAAQSLVVLAEPDEDARADKLDALHRSDRPPSPTTSARLSRLVRRRAPKHAGVPQPEARPAPPGPSTSPPPPPSVPEPSPEEDATEPAHSGESAAKMVAAGKAALKSGDGKAAERAFHRALQIDRDHPGALSALAHLYFDRGSYTEAVRYGKRAVAASPRSGALRILLGDAHFKVLAYDAARQQYEKAAKLSHRDAAGRLALLRDKLGR